MWVFLFGYLSLNRTPIFDWCVIQRGSKNIEHLNDVGFKEHWTMSSESIHYSTLNNEHIGGGAYVSNQEFKERALVVAITDSSEVWFLLMLHCKVATTSKFCCVSFFYEIKWSKLGNMRNKLKNTHTPYSL